jgi:large subunit ribosomal protein L10
MPNTKNIEELNNLKEKLSKANSVIFAEYHGLRASDIDSLRNKIYQAGGEMRVTKNTLMSLALKEQGLDDSSIFWI